MRTMKTVDAVGQILAHDITRIVPGEFKGVAFKKGHLIEEKDVPELLKLGKDNIYIYEFDENKLHENQGAEILGEIGAGKNIILSEEIKEGKINFYAGIDGYLRVDREQLKRLNMLGEISFATLPGNIMVKKGDLVGGARVIPLVIDKKKMEKAREIIEGNILSVDTLKKYRVGVITTGNEVFYGRIEDKFGPVLMKKLKDYGSEIIEQVIVNDDKEKIKEAGRKLLEKGAEMLLFTGGMSVDPDDLTPTSIMELGGELVTYGTPVLPGSMFLLAYLGEVPIMGLPGCVMYTKRSIFDLVLPRVLAGERLTFEDMCELGHGGLCTSCEVCHFPNCTFGKN
ncbi:molybdopterin-binding protein [Cetobacterium sp. SF1]|uniref:molybdopterin-binding protein n=1 Tax=unclassified Cetobacterium TaxID=2630983 RepID=UPI003CE835B0